MAIITEHGVNSRQNPFFLDEYVVFAVYQDVGNLQMAKQGLERAEAEDYLEEVRLNLLLFAQDQWHALAGDDLDDDGAHCVACRVVPDMLTLPQIELGDQRP